jgi:hypothetical protein
MRWQTGFFLTVLLSLAGPAGAQPTLEFQQGWEGKQRAGRWNPVFVRAADRTPHDIIFELESATEGGFGTSIREHVAIGPNKGTFEFYAPSHYSPLSQDVLVIRDADGGRAIAQTPSHLSRAITRPADIGPNGIFIGVSGKPSELTTVRQGNSVDAGYLPPRLLPRSAIGYDGIECLFLNQTDLGDLEAQQQRAILDWVRAGGGLLLTPSADRPPASGTPLADALPCQIGDLEMLQLSPAVLQMAGFPSQFAQLTARRLKPVAGASRLEIIPGGNAVAFSAQYGLGRIVVAPIDLAGIAFEGADAKQKASTFWKPILANVIGVSPPEPKRQYDAPYYGYQSESEDQEREGAAIGTLCDFVASPTPLPRRIPLVLLVIFAVMGPIDSIVLFSLGRRPWAWCTAAGWLALLGGGALLLVQHLRPAAIECRDVRLLEQVDDTAVATTELVGFSSSVQTSRAGWAATDNSALWWQPAIPGLAAPQDLRTEQDLGFHESDSGNHPERFVIEPGRPRFLRADHVGAAPPVVEVALSIHGPESARSLMGTIRNVSAQSLTSLRVRTRFGVATIPLVGGALPPGQNLSINLPAIGEAFAPQKAEAQYQSYGYFGSRHLQNPVREDDLWAVAPDLSGRRSLRVDEWVGGTGDYCCIYVEMADAPALPGLAGDRNTHTRTYEWLRALVRLKP